MTGLNWTKVPAVLFEMGFITNPAEENKLSSEEYQLNIAKGILDGIIEYFNK